jgi:hypothetical protein
MEDLQIVGYDDDCDVLPGDADPDDIVGGFFGSIAKVVKGAGKVVKQAGKAAGNAVSAVGRNKVFQVAMPVAAIAAHTTAKTLGGKPVFKGALGKAIDAGAGVALGKVSAVAKTNLGNAFVFPQSGVPSLQATATANALIKAAKAPATKAKALGVISRTRALAAKGDVSAKRAVSLLATAAKATAKPVKATPPKPQPKPKPKPPVKATPKAPSSASSPVRGFFIGTEGAQRGRIDFTSGLWTPGSAKSPAGIVVHTAGAQRGHIDRSGRWARA